MAKVQLDSSDQHILKAVHGLGWLSVAQTEVHLAEMDHDQDIERYFLKQKLIDDKQLEHLLLYRNLPESIGAYRITDVIGAGAMGVVYLANGPDQQEFALKVINKKHCDDEEFIRRFERETRAVSELQHENIVSSEDSGTYEEQLYLATEYIDGPSLVEILDDYGPLPEIYVLKIIAQIVKGLKHAYDQSAIVHRDIKPANILIDHQGQGGKDDFSVYPKHDIAKIIDFGLAKRADDTDNLTLTGLTVGTPHYMAPEQIRADRDLDCRADMYSVGATMYHLLTGQPPYIGNSPGGIMLAHVNDDIPDPSRLVPSLKDETVELLMCSLAKKKEERYTNYAAMLQMIDLAIERFEAGDTGIQLLRKPLKMSQGIKLKKNKKKRVGDDAPARAKGGTKSEGGGRRYLDSAQSGAETVKTGRIESPRGIVNSSTSSQVGSQTGPSALKDQPARVDSGIEFRTEMQKSGAKPRMDRSLGTSSSSLRRILSKRVFSSENSAVHDEDMQDRLGISSTVWIAFVVSWVVLAVALAARYL